VVRQEALARLLDVVGRQKRAAFYEGPTASAIAAAVAACGGPRRRTSTLRTRLAAAAHRAPSPAGRSSRFP
jgi:hypothetical protein